MIISKDGDVNSLICKFSVFNKFLIQRQGEYNEMKIANIYAFFVCFFFFTQTRKYIIKLERTMFDSKIGHTHIGRHLKKRKLTRIKVRH